MAVMQTQQALAHIYRQNLRQYAITEQQWRILRALNTGGPLQVRSIAEATSLPRPSVSRVLPYLESRGMIRRRRADRDLRRSEVELDELGRQLIATHEQGFDATLAHIVGHFGLARAELLLTLLGELSELLSVGGELSERPLEDEAR